MPAAVRPDGIVVAAVMLLPASPVARAVMLTEPATGTVAAKPTGEAPLMAFTMLVARIVALTAAAPDQRWKFGLVLEPSVPVVMTDTVSRLLLNRPEDSAVVKPVDPTILAVTSTLGLVLPVTVTPLPGCVALVPHCHVLVLDVPPLALPLVIAAATSETTVAGVAEALMKHSPDVTVPDQLAVLSRYTIPAIVKVESLSAIVASIAIRSTSTTGALAVTVSGEVFVIVIVLPLATLFALIAVVCDAAVPGLAVNVVPFTTAVPVIDEAVNVPVWLALAPPATRLVLNAT